MIDYIKENISWIKDLFTLLFVGTGTIVTILTYRRARATVLQPIRTEVIKKQSEILSKLLQILKENNQSFEVGLDYVNLVQTNVLLCLRDYGFIFKDQKEIIEKLEENLAGWTYCGKSRVLKDVEVIDTFSKSTEATTQNDYGLQKYNNLKIEFRNDPFMPTTIQQTLTELSNDINNNLSIILKSELEIFMLDFSKVYFEENKAPHFDPIGVYNNFNHSRIHHRETENKLRSEIRKYLRIDEGW